ncbi:MAG: Bax inhibitor-1 family protein [Chloroflexi bacterium]|nr:Bax inhibitor-1 family protein [Chloroflexota bacterium]
MYQPRESGLPDIYAQTQVRSGVLGKVLALLAFSMIFTAAGALVGVRLGGGITLVAAIAMLVCVIAVSLARNVPVLNLGLLYGMTFFSGLMLGPLIDIYVRAGLGGIVYQAAGMTAALTFGLSAYALTTRRDFSRLGDYLFFGLLALIVAGLVGLFVHLPALNLLLGLGGAVIFSLYILVDVQRARHLEDTVGNAVLMTVALYLNILNLFLSLLRLLTALSGGDE